MNNGFYERNLSLINRVYKLQGRVEKINPVLAEKLSDAIAYLVGYRGSLGKARERDLQKFNCIHKATIPYLLQVFSGISIKKILKTVPIAERIKEQDITDTLPEEPTDIEGAWENGVRALELVRND